MILSIPIYLGTSKTKAYTINGTRTVYTCLVKGRGQKVRRVFSIAIFLSHFARFHFSSVEKGIKMRENISKETT